MLFCVIDQATSLRALRSDVPQSDAEYRRNASQSAQPYAITPGSLSFSQYAIANRVPAPEQRLSFAEPAERYTTSGENDTNPSNAIGRLASYKTMPTGSPPTADSGRRKVPAPGGNGAVRSYSTVDAASGTKSSVGIGDPTSLTAKSLQDQHIFAHKWLMESSTQQRSGGGNGGRSGNASGGANGGGSGGKSGGKGAGKNGGRSGVGTGGRSGVGTGGRMSNDQSSSRKSKMLRSLK